MKWSELKSKAIENGFQFKKHGKKHDEYVNPTTGARIQIERHWSQEVRPGLLKRLKQIIGF
ncbi:MAG: type II toxin-antitoxin system HicA family toxin [Muribaculaceae bacterium]|nr:type II toxin-antitoxin system HicA family toxin [Muribaculaceae bacterium]